DPDAERVVPDDRVQVVRDVEARLHLGLLLLRVLRGLVGGQRRAAGHLAPVGEQVHAGDLAQELQVSLRVVLEELHHLEQVLALDGDHLVAAVAVRSRHGLRELLPNQIDEGLRHGYFPRSFPRKLRFLVSGSTSGALSRVAALWSWCWILSW